MRETHHSVERMQRPDQHCMRMEMLFLLRSSPASKNARPGVILGTARQPAGVSFEERSALSSGRSASCSAARGGCGTHSSTKPVATSIHAVSPPSMGIAANLRGAL